MLHDPPDCPEVQGGGTGNAPQRPRHRGGRHGGAGLSSGAAGSQPSGCLLSCQLLPVLTGREQAAPLAWGLEQKYAVVQGSVQLLHESLEHCPQPESHSGHLVQR